MVIWFTGLSGAGKTTLAKGLFARLQEMGRKSLLLDGDTIRSTIHTTQDFSIAGIIDNNTQIIQLCERKMSSYDFLIVSVIAPYSQTRSYARELLGEQYYEVYVVASIEELKRRDTKGLYKRAFAGELKNLIGVDPDRPYEQPVNPDLIIDTESNSENRLVSEILKKIILKEKEL